MDSGFAALRIGSHLDSAPSARESPGSRDTGGLAPRDSVVNDERHEERPSRAGSQVRKRIAAILNARLADAIDLQLQAKQAHWNVKGPQFIALHELFDQVASGRRRVGRLDRRARRAAGSDHRRHGPDRGAAQLVEDPSDRDLRRSRARQASLVRGGPPRRIELAPARTGATYQSGSIHSSGQSPGASFSAYSERPSGRRR